MLTDDRFPNEPDKPALSTAEIARFGQDPTSGFADNLAAIEARITRACARAGRDRGSVRLLPISKTVPASVLRRAFAAGIRHFGENKVQEACAKREALGDLPISWSIVGHLQTNKVKHVARSADAFQALDSLRLAERLNARLEREGRILDVHVQINTSGEASKYGLHPDAVLPFVASLARYQRLRPRGLMTLALFDADPERVRPCFRLLREVRDKAVRLDPAIVELSMGMSGDFEVAIEEGADVVRVGQALFGRRPTPDNHYWPATG